MIFWQDYLSLNKNCDNGGRRSTSASSHLWMTPEIPNYWTVFFAFLGQNFFYRIGSRKTARWTSATTVLSRMTIDEIIGDEERDVKVSDGLQLLIHLIPVASNSGVQPEEVPPVGVLGRKAANHYHRVLWERIFSKKYYRQTRLYRAARDFTSVNGN